MSTIHFLNVLEGDCNIIQHDSGRVSVIDVSNAYDDTDTDAEKAAKNSATRQLMKSRTGVPTNKTNYRQKEDPDNPVDYLNKLNIKEIWRFIITHPDMDHLDGIKDLYNNFRIPHTWDTNNDKFIYVNNFFAGYNKEDWEFYTDLRDNKATFGKRLTNYDYSHAQFWPEDNVKILCPTEALVKQANSTKNYHDLSYVLLFTPPKTGGGNWKIIFAGDSEDNSWDYIIDTYKDEISNVEILFAPHHGRDSGRNYDFLNTLNPKITLFGNASSAHLAYDKYPELRITNNQAGYVVMNVVANGIDLYVKNKEFADDFRNNPKRGWGDAPYNNAFEGWHLCTINP